MRKLAPLLMLALVAGSYIAYPSARHHWALRQLRTAGFDLGIPPGIDPKTASALQAQRYVDAACSGKPEILPLLLDTRIDVNSANDKGVTALHCLAAEGPLDQVRLLLDHGAQVSPRADLGRDIVPHKDLTPMHVAAAWHHIAVVELLRTRGANIDEPSHAGPPLMIALAVRGKERFAAPAGSLPQEPDLLAVWQAFRRLGARAEGSDQAGNSLLHIAMRAHQRPLIESMLESGDFDLNRPNAEGETPFMTYLRSGRAVQREDGSGSTTNDLAFIEDLIRRGADVNTRNNQGFAPILGAVFQPDLFDLLIRHGANPFVAQNGGQSIWSELSLAPSAQVTRFADTLPQLSRPLEKNGKPGNGPLHVFTLESRADVVEYFLKRGVSPNDVNDAGDTPLHASFAIPFGPAREHGRNYPVVRLLLDAGADPNARNAADMTPLMQAGREPTYVIQLLIAKGADVNAVAKQGGRERHVLDYFAESQNLEAIRLLMSAGANRLGSSSSGNDIGSRKSGSAQARR